MSKTIKIILGIVFLAVVVVLAVVFYKPTEKGTIKVGIITMTSGELAYLGQNIIQSAQIAIDDLKKDGENIDLIIEDIGGYSKQSQTLSAFEKLVNVDKVQYIINGVSSNDTMALAPLIDKYKVTVITPLTGGENIDNAAEYLFRNGPSDIKAGTQPADDIYNKFNINDVAVLTDNAEYTIDIVKHFRNAYLGKISFDELIIPDQTDYRATLSKVKSSSAKALVLNTATGISAAYIIKQAYELGINIPIFANFLTFSPNLIQIAGNAANGTYIYDPQLDENSKPVQSFFNKYKNKYGSYPIIKFHATGTYDAVKMGLEAIRSVGYSGEKIHDYLLKNIKNWEGFNGVVSFDVKGNTQTGFVLKQIKNGMLESVK